MALISCPKCGKQISDKAVKCPHCGVDLTEPFGEYDDSFFELVENVLDALEWDYDVDHEKKCFVSQNLPSYSSICLETVYSYDSRVRLSSEVATLDGEAAVQIGRLPKVIIQAEEGK